ncbi:L-asparaginase 1 [Geothrix limicola]|uniref:L-asparaginase 1 n=1 Tax=Geothrix limicola TaxID=2927978 RepID=A0ABQ5QG37_9BACT|nr:asparaginase [Geothrix limicola]GLH73548.1 L-asparaginase 1 [Geothrix limicola]
MRKILLLHTGGTLGMMPSGEPASLAPGRFLEHLLVQVPELGQLAQLSVEVPFNQDSSCLEPADILVLAQRVREAAPAFDGFVIIHGTDTMAFTASVLGFLLADLGKPVVLTGSQRPLAFVRSDARSNLVNAVDLACRAIPEIGICFGTHWLRGVAADKLSVSQFEAFQSLNLPPLAEIGAEIRLHPTAGQFARQMPVDMGRALELSIRTMTPHPGMPWFPAPAGAKAVLIQAFGAGNLPMGRSDLMGFLEDCHRRQLPVVVTSQCPHGGVDLSAYELGRKIETLGAISGGLHTRWAALAKLGIVLGAGGGVAEVREAFATAWAGEPTPEGAWPQA